MEAASSERTFIRPAPASNQPAPPDGDRLRALFDAAPRYSVGIEDEVMLLDPETLELAPRAAEVLARLGGDERFKLELPAAQMEIVTPVSANAAALAAALLDGRRTLAAAAAGLVRPAAAGVHPFSSGIGDLNTGEYYDHTITEYGLIARRQLVCALQVHVAVGEARRALAVYNVARSYLPLLAALAANAPFYEGRDTGLASVRPKLSQLLPRQGVPPAFDSWDHYGEMLAWGAATGTFPSPRTWWWELRPHTGYGTLEFRVPDGQATVADAIALAAVIQGLVAWLGERHDAGERATVADSWRIDENRWSACRHGVEGTMADLRTGEQRTTRECLLELFEQIGPAVAALGSTRALEHAHRLVRENGAIAQRRAAHEGGGSRAAASWLAERFQEGPAG